MADQAETPEESKPAKKKPPIVPLAAVLVVMIVEAVVVFMVVGATSGGSSAEASQLHDEHSAEGEQIAEVPVFTGQFQNLTSGRVYIWNTEIVLEVRRRNVEFITHQLESRQAAVREAIARIYRRMQHAQLKEPGSETLNRQLTAMLDDFFGPDA
ncbi:MAG: hypothetical protein KDA05_11750, partial [Phycisphaerales bacterium]|nr:hypothetical protein [Phycisphaerales bacterium]